MKFLLYGTERPTPMRPPVVTYEAPGCQGQDVS